MLLNCGHFLHLLLDVVEQRFKSFQQANVNAEGGISTMEMNYQFIVSELLPFSLDSVVDGLRVARCKNLE